MDVKPVNNARWKTFQLSRLMLGTVQFGMPYGVANRTGQPSYDDVRKIVAAAVAGGVNCFDTAAAYGTSEEVLGRVLHELNIADKVIVVTKIRPLTPEELADHKLAAKAIEDSVEESLRRLQMEHLPIVLFHREIDAAYVDVLSQLQTRGLIEHFGVSCDNQPGPAAQFVNDGHVSALQIPANILDHRHPRSGIFSKCQSHDVAVFIRSVYLQGLLVMPEDRIPAALHAVVPARRTLQTIAAAAGLTLAELSLRYMLSQPGVTSVLTGVETVTQVHDNLAMFSRGKLSDDILSAIDLASIELSETLLTPAKWGS